MGNSKGAVRINTTIAADRISEAKYDYISELKRGNIMSTRLMDIDRLHIDSKRIKYKLDRLSNASLAYLNSDERVPTSVIVTVA